MDLRPIFRNKWMLFLGLVGILCLLIGSFWHGNNSSLPTLVPTAAQNTTAGNANALVSNTAASAPSSVVDPAAADETSVDKQLSAMLQKIVGIHAVSVMVTMDATAQLQVANNLRTTNQSQTDQRQTMSQSKTTDQEVFTVRNSDGSDSPFITSRVMPRVRGVLVTVNADDFYVAKSEIIDAIRNVLDVPAYKISVEPQKG